MLKQRILTAVLLAPIVIIIILYGNDVTFTLFTGLLALLIGFEWNQIVRKSPVNSWLIAIIVAVCLFSINYASFIVIDVNRILIAASVLWSICFFWLFKPKHGHVKITVKYALGIGILLLFGASLNALHQIPNYGPKLTLSLFLLVWVADIGAYISGKLLGKHKLAPLVSPGKTIEGLLGGLVLSCVYGYLIALWLHQDWLSFVIVFPLIASISVIGDLFASLLKRHTNVKDSGFLLPGHGGFLDRFDSLIAAAPFYFVFVNSLQLS
jgi:CDP-diglyceride synthetase